MITNRQVKSSNGILGVQVGIRDSYTPTVNKLVVVLDTQEWSMTEV